MIFLLCFLFTSTRPDQLCYVEGEICTMIFCQMCNKCCCWFCCCKGTCPVNFDKWLCQGSRTMSTSNHKQMQKPDCSIQRHYLLSGQISDSGIPPLFSLVSSPTLIISWLGYKRLKIDTTNLTFESRSTFHCCHSGITNKQNNLFFR